MLSISQIRASGGPFDLIERDGEDPRTLPFLDRRAAPVLPLRERQCSGVVDERRAGHAVRGCRRWPSNFRIIAEMKLSFRYCAM